MPPPEDEGPPANATVARRKLKRHRLAAAERGGEQPALLDAGGRIELLRPSAEQPALRRYVPRPEAEVTPELCDLGVLDWRGADTSPVADIAAVANAIICGDAAQSLRRLPEASIACVITSPPYWNAVDPHQ